MKSAILFGGAGGIGSRIAKDLKKEGFGVIIADVSEPKKGTGDFFVSCDAASEADVKRVVLFAQDKFSSIDLVINCQGQYLIEVLENTEVYNFQKLLDINLKSVFVVCKVVVPIMKWQKRGYIISIASMAGLRGKKGQTAYCASKFGLVGLTEALFEELKGTNVRISAVCPSSVDTSMLNRQVNLTNDELEQILKPEDISDVVLYLIKSNPRVRQKIVPIEMEYDIDKLGKKRTI